MFIKAVDFLSKSDWVPDVLIIIATLSSLYFNIH